MKSETLKFYISAAVLVLLTVLLLTASGRVINFHARQWTENTTTIGGTL
ncbi:MAG: hypothetical protein PQJ50_03285 [Spirochaetales bacterium]|nr:hypothetical protein [Spirochaetales bacterium]